MIKYGVDAKAVAALLRLRLIHTEEQAIALVAKDLPKAKSMIKEAMAKNENSARD